MKYPRNLKPGDTVGVTACSDGRASEIDRIRLNSAVSQWEARGYHVRETAHVRYSEKGRSAQGTVRGEEFMQLMRADDIAAVFAVSGGEYLVEMLPYVDYAQIAKHPKWVQGYSDPTGLTFTVTTLSDVASCYAGNFGDFGMVPWHSCLEDNLRLLEGQAIEQSAFPAYVDGFVEKVTGLEGYPCNAKTVWTPFGAHSASVTARGRLLGGCFDVLLNLIGTRFDQTAAFVKRYREDGILWYLESFSLSAEALVRGLWQCKEAGWFAHAKGFLFGRPAMFETCTDTEYAEAVLSVLGDLDVPIIGEMCFGHKPPRMTIVNGAIGEVRCENGGGTLVQRFC